MPMKGNTLELCFEYFGCIQILNSWKQEVMHIFPEHGVFEAETDVLGHGWVGIHRLQRHWKARDSRKEGCVLYLPWNEDKISHNWGTAFVDVGKCVYKLWGDQRSLNPGMMLLLNRPGSLQCDAFLRDACGECAGRLGWWPHPWTALQII